MELKVIPIDKPEDMNFILGHSHFIKTVEDVHEAVININPSIEFGMAFCEASQDALVRYSGTDEELIELAKKNAFEIGAGHSFILFLGNAFPVNVLTANPTQVIVAETEQGRAILGVVDGVKPKGIETKEDIQKRKDFLRMIGYKF